ncbi:MAG: SDR family oxidoreductase [Clostridia bacterium]|nr:SDR family oxidoreductase [Clostridia bacterium]
MNKVAFITGAGGYIGGETAVTLAKQGIRIAVCDINTETIEKTVKRIKEIGGEAKGYVFDVTDSNDVDRVVDEIVRDFGRLDIMVHIAGGSARIAGPDAKYAPLVKQEDYVIDRVLKINLYGAFWASRAAARVMIKQGEGGKIINFSSAVGLNGLSWSCDYAAAKGGIISLTKSLAKELGPHKINVNSVAPGVVCRPEVDTTTEHGKHYAYETNVLGEKCTAEDIANLVCFLASDKARFITGQTYVCDGGRTLSMKGTD